MSDKKSPIDEILDRELATPVEVRGKPDISSLVKESSANHGVPEELVHAVIQQESGGRANAKSPVGASGLMQLMPETAKSLGVTDINNPAQNIDAGVRYLKQMKDQFGSWDLALAAYNAGPGNVNKHGGIPPFKETQNYVKNIMGNVDPSKLNTIDDILDSAGVPPLPSEESLAPQTPAEILAPMEASATPSGGDLLSQAQAFFGGLGSSTGSNLIEKGVQKFTDPSAQAILNLLGSDKNVFKYREEQKASQKKATEEHPVLDAAGILTGTLAGPVGKIKAPFVAESLAAKAGKLLLEGGLQGGAYEALQEGATPESVKNAAALGGATSVVAAPITKLVGKGLQKGSEQLINFATGSKAISGAGKLIAEKLGPTLSRGGLKDKAYQMIVENEAALQNILKNHSNKTVDLRAIAQSDDIVKMIESLDNVEQRGQATALLNKLAKFEKKGAISVEDANVLKRDFWKQSFNANSEKKTVLGKFYRSLGEKLKTGIEEATGDPSVKKLNREMGDAIQLGKALTNLDNKSPLSLRNMTQLLMGASTGGASFAATSTPGATTLGTAGYKVGKGIENSKAVKTLLNVLVPQASKKMDKRKQ